MRAILSWGTSKVTYANVTATLALVLAMAGGAGAATLIAGAGKGQSITACVARGGALTVPSGAKCRSGQRSVRLARAPLTVDGEALRGPAGPVGAQGPAGTPDLSGVAQGRNARIDSAATQVPTGLAPTTVMTIPGIGKVVASGTATVTDFVLENTSGGTLTYSSSTSSADKGATDLLNGATGLLAGAAGTGTINAVIRRPATFGTLGTVVHLTIGNNPSGTSAVPTEVTVQAVASDLPPS